MKKYYLLIICFVLILSSIIIGGLSAKKFKIITSSIPKEVKKGETFQIDVDTSIDKKLIYYVSSNSDIVNVTSGGIVIPIDSGEATITAYYTDNDNSLSDDVKIKVIG